MNDAIKVVGAVLILTGVMVGLGYGLSHNDSQHADGGLTHGTDDDMTNQTMVLVPQMNGQLVPTDDAAQGSRIIAWNMVDWQAGIEPPTWTSEPQTSMQILAVEVLATYTPQDVPLQQNPSRPELTTWFGIDGTQGVQITGHGFHDGSLEDGQYTGVFDMELPAGGLYVPHGSNIIAKFGHYFLNGRVDAEAPILLLGSDQTRVTITYQERYLPPLDAEDETQDSLQATLPLGRCTVDVAGTADRSIVYPVKVTPEMTGIVADVRTDLSPPGGVDVDLMILAPDGTRVGHGAGPGDREVVELRETALEPYRGQTLTIIPFACHQGVLDLTLYVSTFG